MGLRLATTRFTWSVLRTSIHQSDLSSQRAHRFARRYRRHRSPASGCCRGDRVRERHRVRERSPVPQGGDRSGDERVTGPRRIDSLDIEPRMRNCVRGPWRAVVRDGDRTLVTPGHEDGVDRSAFDRCPRVFGR